MAQRVWPAGLLLVQYIVMTSALHEASWSEEAITAKRAPDLTETLVQINNVNETFEEAAFVAKIQPFPGFTGFNLSGKIMANQKGTEADRVLTLRYVVYGATSAEGEVGGTLQLRDGHSCQNASLVGDSYFGPNSNAEGSTVRFEGMDGLLDMNVDLDLFDVYEHVVVVSDREELAIGCGVFKQLVPKAIIPQWTNDDEEVGSGATSTFTRGTFLHVACVVMAMLVYQYTL